MTGLSNSFIANTYSVYFVYFFGSTLSLPRILLSFQFSYHYNEKKENEVQRKFFVHLLQILLQLVN